MRTSLVIVLLFLTYSLLYLPSYKPAVTKNIKIKSVSGFHNVIKHSSNAKIKVYSISDLANSLKCNFVAIYEVVLEQIKKYQKIFLYSACVFVCLSTIFTLVFNRSRVSFFINIINNFEFSLGETIIVLISLFSLGSWFFLRQNFWREIGSGTFLVPFTFLIVSSINLKLYDFNYPIWNRLFKSFIVPIITGFIIIYFKQ